MKFVQPNRWRQLQRHDLSALYEDIKGEAFDLMKLSMKTEGFDQTRPIVLHEGKVLEGWQRQRAAVESGVKPHYAPLPKGITPERYVLRANDWRRHESQEQRERRVEARRARVADARTEGESIRTIAEGEGVSIGTVQRDLESSGVSGDTPDPVAGKVTGADGKQYPAQKPRNLLCERCHRVGPVKGCLACHELRRGKPYECAPHERRQSGKIMFDFAKADSHFGYVAREADDIARAYQGEKDSQEYATVNELLTQLANVRAAWHKRLKKVKED